MEMFKLFLDLILSLGSVLAFILGIMLLLISGTCATEFETLMAAIYGIGLLVISIAIDPKFK